MLPHRKIILALTLLGVIGSLAATTGYGVYLRSDRYRFRIEHRVSGLLAAPVTLGWVEPLSTTSRAFHDIRVMLPTRQAEVFRCRKAVWHEESNSGLSSYTLDLVDGWLLVGTDEWRSDDYRAMIRSGLGQDVTRLRLRRVYLDRVDLEWRHPALSLFVSDATGNIAYDQDGRGQASLVAYDLNGHLVDDPIKIIARFTPGAGLKFHSVRLDVPELPLARLGLSRLLRTEVSHGAFRGSLAYRESGEHEVVELNGFLRGAALDELTTLLIGGPFTGNVDVLIDQAVFVDRKLDSLLFRGRIADVDLTDLLPMLHGSSLKTRVNLRVDQAVVNKGSIEFLSATGNATDVPLEVVSDLVGRGRVTGKLRAVIHDLRIVDDKLQRAEISLEAIPPDDAPGTIDKALLQWAAEQVTAIDIGQFMPSEVEYSRLGARLIVEGQTLRVRGNHGSGNKTILTLKLFGQDVPILRELDRTFEVGELVAEVRQRIESYDVDQMRDWWNIMHGRPPESP